MLAWSGALLNAAGRRSQRQAGSLSHAKRENREMTSRPITTNAIAVGIALAVLPPLPVIAGFYDGNVIFQRCSESDAANKSFCLGYIGGVADSMGYSDAKANRSQCIDNEATMGQLRDVAVAYLRDHPALRHLGAAGLIEFAIREGYCPAPL